MGQAKQRGTREQRVAMAAPKVCKPNAAERRIEMIAGLVAAGTQVIGMTLEAMNRRAVRRPRVAHADGQESDNQRVLAGETVGGNQPALDGCAVESRA